MNGWYLMIKEAADKKYLCKCADNKDHITYKGSGVKWKQFLKDNKIEDVNTQVLGYYTSKKELKAAGIHYSEVYDVVESDEWFNACVEVGDGGATVVGRMRIYKESDEKQQKFISADEDIPNGWVRGIPRYARTPEGRQKLIDLHTGRKRSDETRANMRNATRKKRTTVVCEYCGKSFTPQNIARHKLKCNS